MSQVQVQVLRYKDWTALKVLGSGIAYAWNVNLLVGDQYSILSKRLVVYSITYKQTKTKFAVNKYSRPKYKYNYLGFKYEYKYKYKYQVLLLYLLGLFFYLVFTVGNHLLCDLIVHLWSFINCFCCSVECFLCDTHVTLVPMSLVQ